MAKGSEMPETPPKRLGRRLGNALVAALALAAGVSSSAGAAGAQASKTVVVGCDAFAHSANWERVRGRYDGRFGGASLRSFHAGARATLAFDGTGIRLFGVLGKGGGLAVITLDERVAYVVSFFSLQKKTHQDVFSSKPLPSGHHRLTIEVAKMPHDRDALPGYVNIEGAAIRS